MGWFDILEEDTTDDEADKKPEVLTSSLFGIIDDDALNSTLIYIGVVGAVAGICYGLWKFLPAIMH